MLGPDIVGLGQVRQEPLYLPLVIAATLALVRAWDRRGAGPFALAGALFGLAALCRSMPIYFVAVVAVAAVLRDWPRTAGRAAPSTPAAGPREALALVGGFAALTLPYSIALSIHLGEPTLIENHGGILVASRYLQGGNRLATPGLGRVVGAILQELVTSPVTFIQVTLDQARSLLPLTGGRYLQDGVFAASASSATAWKVAAHAFIDAPWLFAIVLAPLGAAVARNRPAAWLLAAWALLNLGLTALTGFGGSRLRCPFEVHVALLATTVVAGGWPRPRRPWPRPRLRPRRIDRGRAADGAADRAHRCRPGQLRAAVDPLGFPHGRAGERRQRRERPGLARRPRGRAAQSRAGADSHRPADRRRHRRPGGGDRATRGTAARVARRADRPAVLRGFVRGARRPAGPARRRDPAALASDQGVHRPHGHLVRVTPFTIVA